MKLAIVAVVLMLGAGMAHADAPRPKGQLKQLLLDRFDRNHDGRLGPRERRQAAKALHRVAAKLMRADMRDDRRAQRRDAQRHRRFVRRFDLNRDGNVGPGELPPALADELRPLDRDGDGWVRRDELR